ncbi:hypothetical protein HGRIS_013449 [Hohenbuehelia grisea]|uniref:Uncharacterized protein n=1 Tax=Hohenbuehelia grisea TaxID=104357 RepID=A0ABR3IVE5_9AGAR
MQNLYYYDALEDRPKSLLRRWFARPLTRWLAFGVTLILTLWLFGRGFTSREGVHPASVLPSVVPNVPVPITHSPGVPPSPVSTSANVWDQRASRVRDAYLHAFGSYKKYAAGYDELLPLSLGHQNKRVIPVALMQTEPSIDHKL